MLRQDAAAAAADIVLPMLLNIFHTAIMIGRLLCWTCLCEVMMNALNLVNGQLKNVLLCVSQAPTTVVLCQPW